MMLMDPLRSFFYEPEEADLELPDLGLPEVASQSNPDKAGESQEYLSFHLGEELYAFQISSVRQIVRPPPVTQLPRAPAEVLGVVTVRGEVFVVFDPKRRLGLTPTDISGARLDPQARIIICEVGEGACGLWVDSVSRVVRLRDAALEPRPHGVGGAGAEYISFLGRQSDGLIILLELHSLVEAMRANALVKGAP